MRKQIENIKNKIKALGAKMYRFWFQATINEERMRELKIEHLKHYYPTLRL